MNIIHIIKGQGRKLLKINQKIHDFRIENGCKKCAVAHKDGKYTGWCAKSIGGCGCDMSAKTRDPGLKCPQGVWAHDWFKPEVLRKLNDKFNFKIDEQ